MKQSIHAWLSIALVGLVCAIASAQQPPYEITIPANPPYYRVRYEASPEKGQLAFSVSYTIWIPPNVQAIRGVVVHQHGCGEGSCKSGQTGAFDLHWQALAKKHECALLSPVYEQPQTADCQLWCDPRNGSDAAFQKSLVDLGRLSNHPELASVPWALWGHSGGGMWAGGMVLLHPNRIVAAWLRSGVPALKASESRPNPFHISEDARHVPVMCNVGTKEGVTDKSNTFSKVWEGVEFFFDSMRAREALIGVAVDPLSSHECGNQRYLAIPWLDECLTMRLPKSNGGALLSMDAEQSWLAEISADGKPTRMFPAADFQGNKPKSTWLPSRRIAKAWEEYCNDTQVTDTTPPPSPTNVRAVGSELRWDAEADLESGLASFIIERDGVVIARVPEEGKNPRGRPMFQNNSYSDTPTQPLVEMKFIDANAKPGVNHRYRVTAVNTVGLSSN